MFRVFQMTKGKLSDELVLSDDSFDQDEDRERQPSIACREAYCMCSNSRRCSEHGLAGQCLYQLEDPAARQGPDLEELSRLRQRVAELEYSVAILVQRSYARETVETKIQENYTLWPHGIAESEEMERNSLWAGRDPGYGPSSGPDSLSSADAGEYASGALGVPTDVAPEGRSVGLLQCERSHSSAGREILGEIQSDLSVASQRLKALPEHRTHGYNPFDDGHTGEAPEIMAATGTVRKVGGPLAQTKYSNVYRGVWKPDGETGMIVAVKELRVTGANRNTSAGYKAYVKQIDRRLGREMYVWRRMRNPRITPLVGYIRSTWTMDPCLLSPYRINGNLRKYLLAHPEVDKLALLQQAADGIHFLHHFEPKIAHGDIKPENILIGDDGKAEICDFGLAKVLDNTRSGFTSSNAGGFGTVQYISPEGLHGTVDARSTAADIYSFAGVILDALSGRAPFHGASDFQIMGKISSGEVPKRAQHHINGPIHAVMRLWDLMYWCWNFTPVHRPCIDQVINSLSEARTLLKEDDMMQ